MDEVIASDDVFGNLNNTNHTSSPDSQSYRWNFGILRQWLYMEEIIVTLFCLVNVAANVFLIIIILKYKRLRTRPNYYLLNIALMIIMSNFLLPIVHVIVMITSFHLDETLCICFWATEGTCFVMYLLASILAVDWYLVNYKNNFVQFHQKIYKFTIGIVYLIGLIRSSILAISKCIHHIHEIHHFLSLTYLLALITVIVVNFLRIRQPANSEIKKTRYALIASNVIIFSWFPLFVFHYLRYIDYNIIMRILYSIDIVPRIIAHGNIIFLLYILGKTNRNFQLAYSKTFRKNVSDYEQHDLDIESEDEVVIEHHVNIDTKPSTAESGNNS